MKESGNPLLRETAREAQSTEVRKWLPSWVSNVWRRGLMPARRLKQDLKTLLPLAGNVTQRLNELGPVSKELEARFLTIASELEHATATSGSLIGESEQLIELALGDEQCKNAIHSAIQLLMPPLGFLRESHAELERINERLEKFHEQIERTLAIEQTFKRTIEPLRYVQTLFRVESSSCEPAVQQMFLSLVKEIEKLHEQVNGTFQEQFVKLTETQVILTGFEQRFSSSLKEQKQLTESRGEEISQSLEFLRNELEKNAAVQSHLGQVSREISTSTGKVVMALQFQDIISQKLQHVQQAILEMEETVMRLQSETDRAVVGRELRFIQQAGAITTGQIEQVECELREAENRVVSGVSEILDKMKKLDEECLTLRDVDSVATGTDGLVQNILEAFEDVSKLVGDSSKFVGGAHDEIRPVGSATSNVTGLLRRLSREMHLIGLNAQLQSAKVGNGTGLDVLSSETSSISEATNELSEGVASDLDQLHEGLLLVTAAFHRLKCNAASHLQILEANCPSETEKLHAYRDAAIQSLIRVSDLVQKLNGQVQPLLSNSRFESITVEVLDSLKLAISELYRRAGGLAEEMGVSSEPIDRISQFTSRYTMSSERDVHMAAVRGLGELQPASQVSLSAGELDLFDSPTPEPVTRQVIETVVRSGDADLSGVDLWMDDVPAGDSIISQETAKVPGLMSDSSV